MPGLSGLAVSSLFEARLARHLLGSSGVVHLTTPGIRPQEIAEISDLCTAISFNSISQFERYAGNCTGRCSPGIRLNPGISFVNDSRYDPCRAFSKLGVHLNSFRELIKARPSLSSAIEGIHFHSNCESRTFSELLRTVLRIRRELPGLFERVSWINLGGGYLPREALDLGSFTEVIDVLRESTCSVVFEPGAGLVNSACFIISSVLDVFDSEGKNIAILDTTINHIPEVLEYQTRINIVSETTDGPYSYILSGCSCLPGDLFGEFRFARPLRIGDRLVLADVGAYTLVKANTFNGINLPTIYHINEHGELSVDREFSYHEFLMRWQSPSTASERVVS